MSENKVIVEAIGLTKIYGSNGEEVRALDNVNFRIHQAEFVAVMGPSGSGKSTLLNMIGALDGRRPGDYRRQDMSQQLDSLRETVGQMATDSTLTATRMHRADAGSGWRERAHRNALNKMVGHPIEVILPRNGPVPRQKVIARASE
jgi:ABC-type phosphate/phosphonate transport system ATPase subunit